MQGGLIEASSLRNWKIHPQTTTVIDNMQSSNRKTDKFGI